jgi:hypothetical protein
VIPEFTILQHGSEYTFIWDPQTGRSPEGRAPARQVATTRLSHQQQIELQAAIDSAAQVAGQLRRAVEPSPSAESAARQALKRLGSVLFSQLLPKALQEQIAQLPPSAALQISTNDAALPWELLHDDQDFLALRHGVGRLLLASEESRLDAGAKREQTSCCASSSSAGSKHPSCAYSLRSPAAIMM